MLKFKTVTGLVYQHNMQKVLNIYMGKSGITPPVFIPITKEIATGRTGLYAGMSAQFDYDELAVLNNVIEDMQVDGMEYEKE